MKIYQGKSVVAGTAIGTIRYYSQDRPAISPEKTADTAGEAARYERAKAQALKELEELCGKTAGEAGEDAAAIFRGHGMILADEEFNASILQRIRAGKSSAAYAVSSAADQFCRMFAQMEDPYLRERASDVRDAAQRVIRILQGGVCSAVPGDEPVILAAVDLSPSETVQLDRDRLLGFVTELGSDSSHTAILARTMRIPALCGIPAGEELDGRPAVLDGAGGKLIVDPDEETLAKYRARQEEERRQRDLLGKLKGKKTVTADGTEVCLCANIGSAADVDAALENDAEGIGLFRSEFLYLEKDRLPTEEEQFQVYRQVAERMQGRPVVIRTLDIGADKQAAYLNLAREENPAMGYRAIRICLDRPEIFRTQLRAILRAASYGRIGILFPMVISVWEVQQAKKYVEESRVELRRAGIACGEVELGVMIETPAAVILGGQLAEEVDFFSIGTNDLTQYTLAIDRRNGTLDRFYDARHPAVLEMIRMTVESGHRGGCRVGICGELAADVSLTETFLKMGVDELSVAPGSVLPVREAVRRISLK